MAFWKERKTTALNTISKGPKGAAGLFELWPLTGDPGGKLGRVAELIEGNLWRFCFQGLGAPENRQRKARGCGCFT